MFLMKLQVEITTAVFLLCLAGAVPSKLCYEGFNASIAGFPIYYWTKKQCGGKDHYCYMQEIATTFPPSKPAGLAFRYGGCVSKSFASYFTCDQLFGNETTLTSDILFDALRDLERSAMLMIVDTIYNKEKHAKKFFFGGQRHDEIVSNAVDFLINLGYDKTKRAELLQLVDKFDANLFLEGLSNIFQLFGVLEFKNHATEKLGRAFDIFFQNADMHLGKDSAVRAFVGLAYPILHNFYHNDTDALFIAMAKGFEIPDLKKAIPIVEERFLVEFTRTLVMIQLVVGHMHKSNAQKLHDASLSVVEAYKDAFPTSTAVIFSSRKLKIFDIYYKNTMKLPECENKDDADCQSRNLAKELSLKRTMYRELNRISLEEYFTILECMRNSTASSKEDGITPHDVEEFHNVLRANKTISIVSSRLQYIVEKMWSKLGKKKNKIREIYTPGTCAHILCDDDLCNSHSALTLDQKKSSSTRKEL